MLSVGNTKMSKLSYFIIKSLDWLTGSFQCCTVTTNQSMQMCVGALALPPGNRQGATPGEGRQGWLQVSHSSHPHPHPLCSMIFQLVTSKGGIFVPTPGSGLALWLALAPELQQKKQGTSSIPWRAIPQVSGSSTKANRVDSPVHCWPEMHRWSQPRPGLPRSSINLWAIMNAY